MQQVLPALALLAMMGACIYWMYRVHQKDAKRRARGQGEARPWWI